MTMAQTEGEINTDELRKLILAFTTTQMDICAAAQIILDNSPALQESRGQELFALQGIVRVLADNAERLSEDVSIELSENPNYVLKTWGRA